MEDDNVILKRWCDEEDVDYNIALELKEKYLPLLDFAHKMLGDIFDEIFWIYRKGSQLRVDNTKRIIQLLNNMGRIRPQLTPNELAVMALHFQYLPISEGLLMSEINFLIYTLTVNNKKFIAYGEEKNFIDEIEKVPFGPKVKFLREQSFNIISDNIDVKLRNSIAHMFYEISKDGRIFVEGVPINIERVYYMLRNIAYSLHLVRRLYYRRFESPSK